MPGYGYDESEWDRYFGRKPLPYQWLGEPAGEPGSRDDAGAWAHRILDPMNVGEEFLDPEGFQRRRMSPAERALMQVGTGGLWATQRERPADFEALLAGARARAQQQYGMRAPEVVGEGARRATTAAQAAGRRGITGGMAEGAQQQVSLDTQRALNQLMTDLDVTAQKEAVAREEMLRRDRLARLQAYAQMAMQKPEPKLGALGNLMRILGVIMSMKSGGAAGGEAMAGGAQRGGQG